VFQTALFRHYSSIFAKMNCASTNDDITSTSWRRGDIRQSLGIRDKRRFGVLVRFGVGVVVGQAIRLWRECCVG